LYCDSVEKIKYIPSPHCQSTIVHWVAFARDGCIFQMKKSFLVYLDSLEVLNVLTDEQAGKLFKAIRCVQLGIECDTDPFITIALAPFIQQFKRDDDKYMMIVERNRANGLKNSKLLHAEKRTQSNPVGSNGIQSNPMVTDSDSDSVSDSVSTKVDKTRATKTKAPTEQEVIEFFTANGYRSDIASNAFNYYNSAGWRDSRGKSVLNWKQKMRGVWFKDEHKAKQPNQSTYHDIEIEQCILGAMLLEPSSVANVVSQVTDVMYYDPRHQTIHAAIAHLTNQGDPVDLLTINRHLRKTGDLESIGASYLSQLTNRIASTANLDTWCKLLYEFHLMRQMRMIGLEIADRSVLNETDAFDLYAESISKLESILAANIKSDVKHISQLSNEVTKSIITRMNSSSEVSGYSTSIKSIDTLIGGHQKSDLMYMAGRPAMGKTAMALTEVLELARRGTPVAFFSLEMSSQQITYRLMSMLSGIDGATLMKYRLDDETLKTYYRYLDQLNALPIYIDDTPALSVIDLRAKVKRLQHKNGIEVVFVDYVQLMTSGTKGKGVSREQELSHISRNLKLIAKECNIPMIVLAQLSRGVESRSEKRPLLSDLRESGSLEQDADVVTFLFRPEYYDMLRDDSGNSTEGLGEYIVAKQRNGSIGIAQMRFHPSIMKYTDYTENPF